MALREFQSRGGILNQTPEELSRDLWQTLKSVAMKMLIATLFLGSLSGVFVNLHSSNKEVVFKSEKLACNGHQACWRQHSQYSRK